VVYLREALAPAMRAAGVVRDAVLPQPTAPDQTVSPATQGYVGGLRTENDDLRRLLALKGSLTRTVVSAEVIGRGTNPWQTYLVLDRGTAEGVQPRMAVLTADGVLGQVLNATPHTANVLPLTADRGGGIGGMLQRSGLKGVLEGHSDGRCRLKYLPPEADIQVGDLVVTSGVGEVFPSGIPLGTVTAVDLDRDLSSRVATIAPAADPAKVWVVLAVQ
jgi:rod shape-determining protein MreC